MTGNRRIFAIITAITIFISIFPRADVPGVVTASAAPYDFTDVMASNVEVISTVEGGDATLTWGAFRDRVHNSESKGYGETYYLVEDVQLNWHYETTIPEFRGTFVGNNKTVYLTQAQAGDGTEAVSKAPDADNCKVAGLFGWVNGATIRNLRIKTCDNSGEPADLKVDFGVLDNRNYYNHAGILAAMLYTGSTVERVEVYGGLEVSAIHGSFRYDLFSQPVRSVTSGGIAGAIFGTNVTVRQCHTSVEIKSSLTTLSNYYVYTYTDRAFRLMHATGGIAGWAQVATSDSNIVISDCYAEGTASTTTDFKPTYFCSTGYYENYYFHLNSFASGIMGGVCQQSGQDAVSTPEANTVRITNCVSNMSEIKAESKSNRAAMGNMYNYPYTYPGTLRILNFAHAAEIVSGSSKDFGSNISNNYAVNTAASRLSTTASGGYTDYKRTGLVIPYNNETATATGAVYKAMDYVKAAEISDAWADMEINKGVYLKWRKEVYAHQLKPEIEISLDPVTGHSVELKNPYGTVFPHGPIYYSITYTELKKPASPQSLTLTALGASALFSPAPTGDTAYYYRIGDYPATPPEAAAPPQPDSTKTTPLGWSKYVVEEGVKVNSGDKISAYARTESKTLYGKPFLYNKASDVVSNDNINELNNPLTTPNLIETEPHTLTEDSNTVEDTVTFNLIDELYDGIKAAQIADGIASDSVRHNVDFNSPIIIRAWFKEKGNWVAESTVIYGNKMGKPLFSPGASERVTDKIAISPATGESADIYYCVYEAATEADAIKTPPFFPNNTQNNNGYEKYDPSKAIEWKDTVPYLVVWAVAVDKNTTNPKQPSEIATIVYRPSNRPFVNGPRLMVDDGNGKIAFNGNTFYSTTATFYLEHDQYNDTARKDEIRYNINKSATPSTADALADMTSGFKIPVSETLGEYALVKATYFRSFYEPSQVSEFYVRFTKTYKSPLYMLIDETGKDITGQTKNLRKSGNTISFMLSSSSIPADLIPADADSKVTVPSEEHYTERVPRLLYSVGIDAEPGTPNIAYELGRPELDIIYSDGTRIEMPKRAEEKVLLEAPAGSVVKVKVQLVPPAMMSDQYKTTDFDAMTFTIRPDLIAPKASPDPTAGEVGQNSMVELYTDETGKTIEIFYAMGGKDPKVTWSGSAWSCDPATGTELYTKPFSIGGEGRPSEIVRAIAVTADQKYGNSDIVSFRYQISSLDKAKTPTAYPETGDAAPTKLRRGSEIMLRSDTPNASIYYTTDGSIPKPAESGNGKTFKYLNPISMDPTGREFVIWAVAHDDTSMYYTDSDPVRFIYELERAKIPVAFPATSEDDVTVVSPGSNITLTCATAETGIFYTTNNTEPVVTYQNGVSAPGNESTLLYDPAIGITMPSDGKAFFTLIAAAYPNTSPAAVAESESARIIYQPPAVVHGVYASPASGEVIKGTEVQLYSSTKDASIFYEIAYRVNENSSYWDYDDFSDPTPYESQPFDSSKPIIIEKDCIIACIAEKDGVESVVTEYEYTVAKQVKTPTPSIAGGSVVAKGTKVTLSSTSGADIIYTKDGSDPTDPANKKRMYGSDVVIDAEEGKSVSLSAYATKTGLTPSDVVSLSYTVSKQDDLFTANPPSGSTVKPGDQITVATSLTGATLHYTTDGSDPTINSPAGGSILVSGSFGETVIVRVVAAVGSTLTPPQLFTYNIMPQTPSPNANVPDGSTILSGVKVQLSASEGSIYYTLDGTDPNSSSRIYTEPFTLDGSVVLKAIAIAEGKAPSNISQYIYTLADQVAAPVATVAGTRADASEAGASARVLRVGDKVELSTTTLDATIYYSTNGVTPTQSNLKDLFIYDAPIVISRPVNIKMFAIKTGMHASVVNTVSFTVENPPEEEEATVTPVVNTSGRLFLFDQFVEAPMGSLFSDILLEDPSTRTVLSARLDAIPMTSVLQVSMFKSPSTEDMEAVRRTLGLKLQTLYDIAVLDNNVPTQPKIEDSVEIGIPIPDGYENAVVAICAINDNGTVQNISTRRSGSMAYAVVNHLSKYALAVPDIDGETRAFPFMALSLSAAGVLMAGIGVFAFIRHRKRKSSE